MTIQDDTDTKAKKKVSTKNTLPVLTKSGKKAGRTIVLAPDPFFVAPNKHVLYLDITNIRNHQRQGTAKTKDKSEITGSTRKILKQKGSGRARKGSIKSGILRGGGRFFGPIPRQYGFRMNKKEKTLAKKSALSIKRAQQQIVVVEDFTMQKISTKEYIKLISQLAVRNEKVLWVFPTVDRNMIFSAKNIAKNKVTTVEHINSYDLLNATKVLCIESAIPLIAQKFA